jgi:hypothetical protein
MVGEGKTKIFIPSHDEHDEPRLHLRGARTTIYIIAGTASLHCLTLPETARVPNCYSHVVR